VLDWMLRLPPALEEAFIQELTDFEEQAKMPYVTSAERVGHKRGLKEGLQKGVQQGVQEGEAAMLLRLITAKFGSPTEAVRARVEGADSETLLLWSERILTASTIDDLWS
jgi:flagellar biosynthesis/type III secretory pathway protein FliH